MNSQILFAFVLAVNICIISATDQVYNYKVIVSTAAREFGSHEGKLKLSVISDDTNKTTQEDFLLTPNDIEIKQGKIYTAKISSIAPLDNITSVYIRWTLATSNNPYYEIQKPTIYLDSVTLRFFTFVPPPYLSKCKIHEFCPETSPIGIKNEDGATFDFCYKTENMFGTGRNLTVSEIDAHC